jgi:hypothetical protein
MDELSSNCSMNDSGLCDATTLARVSLVRSMSAEEKRLRAQAEAAAIAESTRQAKLALEIVATQTEIAAAREQKLQPQHRTVHGGLFTPASMKACYAFLTIARCCEPALVFAELPCPVLEQILRSVRQLAPLGRFVVSSASLEGESTAWVWCTRPFWGIELAAENQVRCIIEPHWHCLRILSLLVLI